MKNAFRDVMAFLKKFGRPIGTAPSIPNQAIVELWLRLIDEENGELKVAVAAGDLVEIADAIADQVYVLIGTAVTFGIDLPAVWEQVQRANMAKTGGGTRADGKILKPAGWQPPDVAGVIAGQLPIETTYGDKF
jgi:predicted HAD superfamily Cof-like phosphohydrolase